MSARTIDRESKDFITSPIDFERMGGRFKTENGYYSFPDPTMQTLDENLFYLLRNSEEKSFDQKYNYRPDYLSFDIYGTVVLDKLILFVNSISRPEEFANLDKVILPALESIVRILGEVYPSNPPVNELETIAW
jgi:hypothetical protein